MSRTTDRRLAIAFATLTGVTLLSWWLGTSHGPQAFSLNAGISFAVVLIAAFKVRVIVWEFMELRHAPAPLRRAADIYLGLLIGVLLLVYLAGSRMQL